MYRESEFIPQRTLTVPFGEGALEHLFAQIELVDPGLRHFRIAAFQQSSATEPYSLLDDNPCDSELRPPPALPLPAGSCGARSTAGRAGFFDDRNPQDVTPFLAALHNQFHGAADFWTYAVIVMFDPHSCAERAPGIPPPRLFSGAPVKKTVCLLSASGNQLCVYSAEAAARYLELYRQGSAPAAWDPFQPASADTVLPYLGLPRHLFDRVGHDAISVGLPDDETAYWHYRIGSGGVSIPSLPDRAFDTANFEHFRDAIHRMYHEWLCEGMDNRFAAGDAFPYAFARKHGYLKARYPRLRDWMNHCIVGTGIEGAPSWFVTATTVSSWDSKPLSDFVLDRDSDGFSISKPVQQRYANRLFKLVRQSTRYFESFFGEEANGPLSPQIGQETKHLLVEQGFLRAVLTIIGDDECDQGHGSG